ncbi:MAG TPA: hypothetical protein VM901_01220 [Bdellovibrionota bacterium]|nr:hypothetical protein [Bdellovibrionota bacterium]
MISLPAVSLAAKVKSAAPDAPTVACIKLLSATERKAFAAADTDAQMHMVWDLIDQGIGLPDALKAYDATQEQRFNVAYALTEQDFRNVGPDMPFLDLSHDQRYKLAALRVYIHGVRAKIDHYDLTPSDRFALARQYVSDDEGESITPNLAIFKLTPDQNRRIKHQLIARDPTTMLPLAKTLAASKDVKNQLKAWHIGYHGIEGLKELELLDDVANIDELGIPQLQKILSDAKLGLGSVPTKLWDTVQRQDTGFDLLRAHSETDYLPSGERILPEPTDSLQILSRALGYNDQQLRRSGILERTLSRDDFYDVSLTLYKVAGPGFFKNVEMSDEVFSKTNLGKLQEFLSKLQVLISFSSSPDKQDPELHARIKRELGIESPFTTAKLHAALSKMPDMIREEMRAMAPDLNFDPENFFKLNERWQNLDPITVLMGRFRTERSEWHAELPVLNEVFDAVLRDMFQHYKLYGNPGRPKDVAQAKAQLAMLKKPEQKVEWLKPESRLAFFNANQSDSAKLMVENRQRAKDSLPEHLAQLQRNALDVKVPVAVQKSIQELSKKVHTDKTRLAVIQNLLKNQQELGIPTQTRNDLRALRDALELAEHGQTRSDLSRSQIIFTTTTADPRMLLTIGDEVNTSSCQNYRCGSLIGTLLGYVIDANVQAMVSYAISSTDFAAPTDFARVTTAMNSGKPVRTEFDGGARKLTLTFEEDGEEVSVTTNVLPKAMLRRMLKIGTAKSGKAGLVTERPYSQTHLARGVMNAQMNEIVAAKAKALGAVTNQEILVESSRNPGFVYSDKANGVQKGPYRIKPDAQSH